MKASANGWKRLWIVASILWALSCAAFIFSGAQDHLAADSICMVRYPEPKAGDKVPLSDIPSEYPFDIEGARKAGYTDQEIADFLAEKTKGARAESATQKRGACVAASKVRALEGIYWSAGLLVAFPLAIYLIGWCIGWVWRGFFPSP